MTDPDTLVFSVIGRVPYRMALAGGWIDQPFVSRHNPAPPGSMVVASLAPDFHFMERSGMAVGTRRAALKLWGSSLPNRDPDSLVRQLYNAENAGKPEPSGSQDMIGIIYPGISRLDYDFNHEGGIFPAHIERCLDRNIATWLQRVVHILPVMQRPAGYNPLGIQNLDPDWVRQLGQSGKDCFDAILACDVVRLGHSFNESMLCWEVLLPHVVRHPTIEMDLVALLAHYQRRYPGAMYSGCGGGYLFVASEEPVPGSIQAHIRL
jgi:hypothetical protein